MATGICYTQSGNVKRYESGVSIELVKGSATLPTLKIDDIPYTGAPDGTFLYEHYSFEDPDTYELNSKGNKDDNMPLIFVTYYPSNSYNPVYFNFNNILYTVTLNIYYYWPSSSLKFYAFNKSSSFIVNIYNKEDNFVESKIINSKSSCTFKVIKGFTVKITDVQLACDIMYNTNTFYNYGDTFLLDDCIEKTITKDTNIDINITNKYICLSPLWNILEDCKDNLAEGIITGLYERIDSGGNKKMLNHSQYINSGKCCVVGYQDGDGGLFFGAAPLIPTIGYEYLGSLVGWLPAKKYTSSITEGSNGGLYYFRNLVTTIPRDAIICNGDETWEDSGNGWSPNILMTYDDFIQNFAKKTSTPNKYDEKHYRNGVTTVIGNNEIRCNDCYGKLIDENLNITMCGSIYWDASKSDKMRAGFHYGSSSMDNPERTIKFYAIDYNRPKCGVLIGVKAWGSNHQNNSTWSWAQPTFGGIPAEWEQKYPINSVGQTGSDSLGISFFGKDNTSGIVICAFSHFGGSSGPSHVYGNRLIVKLFDWKNIIKKTWNAFGMLDS